MRRLLVLVLVLGLSGAGAAAVIGGTDRRDGRVPGLDVPDPRPAADRMLDRVRGGRPGPDRPSLRRARCGDGTEACRSVLGRIVFVERVDPDGDGDLHVVIADGSITAPGLTSVDVRPGLRPSRDPRVGDLATAAGPVQRGSIGQAQIHARAFRVGDR